MEPPAATDGDVQAQRKRREGGEPDPTAVSLRPLGLEDADAFMAWASDERVMRFLKRPLCATREQAVAQIRDTVLGHPWFRAICGGRRANLGYALARDHWGRGIAAVAISMVVGRVFDDLPALERLEAVTGVDNVRSQRVLEKAGFQREGLLRRYIAGRGGGRAKDAVIYSFLSSDRNGPSGS
ncbi:unnamed protein product [Urochloa decumbens]|uniref:N-acetyltransferase domain-containing protein n=1 Tax=Urochloa decumbens TaxID=240449 RepID=A0ABC8WZG3_9POAL